METLAKRLANIISIQLSYDDEKEQVIAYGMTAIIQFIVSILLVIFFGILFNTYIEALIILFSVSILRKYSGGTHANTIEMCTIVGIIYSIIFSLIAKYLTIWVSNSNFFYIIINIFIYLFSYFVIYKFAPVDTPNKPITNKNKIKKMRKKSFIVLSFYLVVSIALIIFSRSNINFYSYGISLLLGIMWQILNLTKIGFLIMKLTSSKKI